MSGLFYLVLFLANQFKEYKEPPQPNSMGTRGAYGFRIHEQEKVTYNHWDSYPAVLGKKILKYVAVTSVEKMKEVAEKIKLVNLESTPSGELIRRYTKYADLGVSEQSYENWYCLLQGDLFPYHNDLEHMIDYRKFLFDSLFCEWAYIINLDGEQLEVYKGFNGNVSAPGRYAGRSAIGEGKYAGVCLEREILLKEIREGQIEQLVKELENTEANHPSDEDGILTRG